MEKGDAHMKELLLLRHAKSDWADSSVQDHDRPLNERGRLDASRMGKVIRKYNVNPDIILSSTAKRALKTAKAVRSAAHTRAEIVACPELYLAEANIYIERLQQLASDIKRPMIVGHNPGMENLLELLTGKTESLSPGALAYLHLEIENWADLSITTAARIRRIWRPREITDQTSQDD